MVMVGWQLLAMSVMFILLLLDIIQVTFAMEMTVPGIFIWMNARLKVILDHDGPILTRGCEIGISITFCTNNTLEVNQQKISCSKL